MECDPSGECAGVKSVCRFFFVLLSFLILALAFSWWVSRGLFSRSSWLFFVLCIFFCLFFFFIIVFFFCVTPSSFFSCESLL